MNEADLYGDWDSDQDEVIDPSHNPNCGCDECDPIDSEVEPECDIDSPDYHAPNMCNDPNCTYIQCDTTDNGGAPEYPGDHIWWKTAPNLDALIERMREIREKTK